ncbi:glycosyltransferase [Candidatus Saccharibacteria bacterium]|nr:glycosyltransferase [Candidatus Saccharibacteria bacterium]
MKRKIVFILEGLYNGGTEIALMQLTRQMDHEKYDIYVYYEDHEYSDPRIVEKVRPNVTFLEKGQEFVADVKIIVTYMADEGIFQQIKSQKTYFWFHTFDKEINEFVKKHATKFDGIVTVSEFCKKGLSEWNLPCPIKVINNYVDAEMVRAGAEESCEMELSSGLNFIVVARFAPSKRYDRVKKFYDACVERDLDFKIFIIGDANEYHLEYGKYMDETFSNLDNVEMLGMQENPYKYMSKCDYTLVLSEIESWSLVVSESKILDVPCICSDFGPEDEQIKDGVNGIIYMDEDYASRLDEVVSQQKELKENLRGFQYDNEKILRNWDEVLEQ